MDVGYVLLARAAPSRWAFRGTSRVQAYTIGYDREFALVPYLSTAFGGHVTLYGKADLLTSIYGKLPVGAVLFLRFKPISKGR